MPLIHGVVTDEVSGELLEAKVHVLDGGGRPCFPPQAIRKVGGGLAGFYADGEFTVEVPYGWTTLLVERGTEYEPLEKTIRLTSDSLVNVSLRLQRWSDLPNQGWYPGNTHFHYDEKEDRPDERLRLDILVHDLHVAVISGLHRRDLQYSSNKYPVGLLNDFCTAHHVVDCGEENRHNREPWEIGYGHVMLLHLQKQVLPISRGVLVDEDDPDYPPLCHACDDAREQGGLAIWCHNGRGMEAPVAAVLGKLDALNLFDPFWVMPEEYDLWYHMLNCGLRLPASTGSDWFICSNNRVYVQVDGPFSYEGWLEGLQCGRTFITNGPVLFLSVSNQGPGACLDARPGQEIEVQMTWRSHHPIEAVELIAGGQVAATRTFPSGSREGKWTVSFDVRADGWIAARVSSTHRDSFYQPAFAHTSPIWLRAGIASAAQRSSAAFFVRSLDEALAWIRSVGAYANDRQQAEVLALFKEGQEAYRRLF